METKVKNEKENCRATFEIEVSKERVDSAFDEVYNEIAKVANIPGFRVGKAPKELVKKHYARHASEEVLKTLIPEGYQQALEEHKIDTLGLPEISDIDFSEGKKLLFKAKVDTKPGFKIKEYKGIKVDKKKVVVKDDEVEKTLENLREMNAQYVAVEDRPIQMGDYVVTDMECFVDGKAIHRKRENLWYSVDKETLVPELSEKMVGMKKGEARDIDVVLPEKYPDKNVAGKKAQYHVLAKEIKVRKLPNIDDDFAKDLKRDSLTDLKKEVREELEMRAKANAEVDMENQILKKLMDENVFPVPPNFVTRQIDMMVENAKKRLAEKGFKKEDLDKKDAELKEKFKDDAVRQVRLLFILDVIAEAEKISVSDDDVDNAYKSIASQAGRTEKEVRAYYEKEELTDNLKEKLREEKTVKFLIEKAQVTEKE